MGAAVDLTPGTASPIFFQIRPFWPFYLDAFTLVKALCLPKWSAFFYEGQIFIFSLQLLSSALETLLGLFRSLKEKKAPNTSDIQAGGFPTELQDDLVGRAP